MYPANIQLYRVPVIAEEAPLTLVELCQASHAFEEHAITWLMEGNLEVQAQVSQDWRFTGPTLQRAEMPLDLLDDIAELQARLLSLGVLS